MNSVAPLIIRMLKRQFSMIKQPVRIAQVDLGPLPEGFFSELPELPEEKIEEDEVLEPVLPFLEVQDKEVEQLRALFGVRLLRGLI